MKWAYREMRFRGVWESHCRVDGCTAVVRLEGPLLSYLRSPSGFSAAAEMPKGWCRHKGWVVYPEMYVEESLLCPEHAPVWQDYITKMEAWDDRRRQARKTWWETFKSVMLGYTDPMPESPFGASER